MSWPGVFAARFRGLFVRDRLERELDDEVHFHLEMQAEDNRRAGMNPAEARHAARRSFGGVEPMKETFRERRTFAWLETVVKDMTHGARFADNQDLRLLRAFRLRWGSASPQPSSRS
jgi:hypothetical protein